jgi:hypothetical protein
MLIVPFLNKAMRTRIRVTVAFLPTTFVEIGVGGTIHIITKDICRIVTKHIAIRASKGRAPTFHGSTCLGISVTASQIGAFDVGGVDLQDPSCFWLKGITHGNSTTTRISVFVAAGEATTINELRAMQGTVSTWARVGDAPSFIGATFVYVSGGTILVIAQDVRSIGPEHLTHGAIEHAARALFVCASLKILIATVFVKAFDFCCSKLFDPTTWGIK